jgi:hypothetical protein
LAVRFDRFRRGQENASPTILAHIEAHLEPGGVELTAGAEELPDTKPRGPNEIGWSAGAWDGVVTHHVGRAESEDLADEVFVLIRRTIGRDFRSADFGKLYELIRAEDVIAVIDKVLVKVRASGLPVSGIRALGQRLAAEGRHREPVKLGIALLGLVNGDPDRDLLLTLGRHDEFTLYAAVAIANTEPDAARDSTLMSLAKSVNGWGRVHVIERLRDTTDPSVKDWILRGGFRNGVMAEYTAYIAATTGGLAAALRSDEIDDELMDSSGEIIGALICGGPAEDIYDYADGPLAVERFVSHVERRPHRLPQFVTIDDISEFLARDDDKERREPLGWSDELRTALVRRCANIKSAPGWAALATAGLASTDSGTFYYAERTARALGIDTFAAHWRRLQADPANGNWHAVMHRVDTSGLPEVLEFARQTLPLSELGPGASSQSQSDFRTQWRSNSSSPV